MTMNIRAVVLALVIAATAATTTGSMQTSAVGSVDGLVSAAKISAGLEWAGTFVRLCVAPPPAGGRGGAPAGQRTDPPKNTWYAEPAKVADNLYFLGTKIHNSWALVGSEGI